MTIRAVGHRRVSAVSVMGGVMGRNTRVLTTGQVARICKVAPRTVSKWFDSGQLGGYRIPGGKDRRIPLDQLIRFMRAHGIPLEGLELGGTRVLWADSDPRSAGPIAEAVSAEQDYRIELVDSLLEAGIRIEADHPQAVIVDTRLGGFNADRFVDTLRTHPAQRKTRLIAVGTDLSAEQTAALEQAGFDATLIKPFDADQLKQRLDSLAISRLTLNP